MRALWEACYQETRILYSEWPIPPEELVDLAWMEIGGGVVPPSRTWLLVVVAAARQEGDLKTARAILTSEQMQTDPRHNFPDGGRA